MSSKLKVARLSIYSNTILIILKLIVGLISGSVSIVSEAIHSTMDLLAAIIAFFSVRISEKAADERHPYGHGKFENVSGVIEALLILVAAIWIIVEGVKKLVHPEGIHSIGVGFIVMFVSAFINQLVSKRLYKVAKAEDSIALEADALHLKADVYTSLGVGFGLLLIWITGLSYLDPIIAILVALFILKEAIALLKTAFYPLLDIKLSDEEIDIVVEQLNKHNSTLCNFHNLRSRKSGKTKYIDLHLVLPENMSVKEAHDLCDVIEEDIELLLKNTEVLIHLESCNRACAECKLSTENNCI